MSDNGCRQQCLPGLINNLAAQNNTAEAVELMGVAYSNRPLAGDSSKPGRMCESIGGKVPLPHSE